MTKTDGPRPAAVPERATRAGAIHEASPPHQEWSWVEPQVWTGRMLAALIEGVKGGKWYSLIDKLYPEDVLGRAFARVAANRGAAGVDHVSVARYARDLDANLRRLSEELRTGSYRPQAIRRTTFPNREAARRVRWASPRSVTGWSRRRCDWCWNRSSSGTSPATAMAFAPDGVARTRCGGSTTS